MTQVRHVLGISGGKDSAALAIYMKDHYPELNIEYYTSDTGKELQETYDLIEKLESYLGKPIIKLDPKPGIQENPFDHFLKTYGGFLPSAQARWCTKKLKLEPFERFVGSGPVISYVGIRGDEDRDGYISKKPNIQSVFPFRQNMWSEDVMVRFLANSNIQSILKSAEKLELNLEPRFLEYLTEPVSETFTRGQKQKLLLDISTKTVNRLVFDFMQQSTFPVGKLAEYPLLNNEAILVKKDIFQLLEDSKVGVPAYYNEVEFESEKGKGVYARSRSGCYFCFYQQKIEWIWLYEQHPGLFSQAQEYEKDGFCWNQDETLEQIIQPERIERIKADHLKKVEKNSKVKSPLLLDILGEEESEGCASCFI
jgi:hypothetical protein